MDIKSFEEWNTDTIAEMADNNNIEYVSSREHEFIDQLGTSFMRLIKNGINSEHYNLYRYGSGTFYLTDANNKYLGFISGEVDNNKFYISMSSSEIKGNFYNLMFTAILGWTDIIEILSDKSLSPKAAKSYDNLKNKSQLNVRLLSPKGYENFNIDKIFTNRHYQASVSDGSNIKESIIESFSKPVIFQLYVNKDILWNNRIYCESNVI